MGLTTAVCFASKFKVVGIDTDRRKVDLLNVGSADIQEDGIRELLKSGISSGRLHFTTSYDDLAGSKLVFLAVGTPSLDSGEMDAGQVRDSCKALGRAIRAWPGFTVIVVKSTVVPGTTRNLVAKFIEGTSGKKAGVGFGLCSNPEFLREGTAVYDSFHPDRLVLGPLDSRSGRIVRGFYRQLYERKMPPMVTTTPETAELAKYASNAFLATKISFINLMARVCERLPEADVEVIARSMGYDERIGSRFLDAGLGFGGSCFPKDLRALAHHAEQLGLDSSLLRAVERINETQPGHVVSLLEKRFGDVRGKTVAILGAAFKPGTNDVRESRGIALIKVLIRRGANPRVYDPLALNEARKAIGPKARYATSAKECLIGADLAIVVNSENEFKNLRPEDYAEVMKQPVLVDTRRIYRADDFSRAFPIVFVGRSSE